MQFATTKYARLSPAIVLSLIGVALSFIGYQTLFSSFATYDDEGYVMISLATFLQGNPLYDATYSQYGPAYYFWNGVFHHCCQVGINHDIVRFKTLVTWLAAASLAGFIVFRITRNRWMGLGTIPIVFFHLDRLGLEPAHPQEFCLLAGLLILLLTTMIGNRSVSHKRDVSSVVVWSLMGLLTATVFMTKINLGIFLGMTMVLAILLTGRRTTLTTGLVVAVTALTSLMPLILMRDHLGSLAGVQLPMLVVGSTLIVVAFLYSLQIDLGSNGLVSCSIFVVSATIGVASYALFSMTNGTSLPGLLDGLVLQHLGGKLFSYAPLFGIGLPCVAVSAWIAMQIRRNPSARMIRWIDLGVLGLVGCLVFRQFTDSFAPVLHGGQDRSLALFLTSLATSFSWIILIPLISKPGERNAGLNISTFARVSLCIFAVIQPLQAFPIPGTQVGMGSLGLVMMLLIAAHDATVRLASAIEPSMHRSTKIHYAFGAALLLLMMTRAFTSYSYRCNCEPLDLPGASRMRLPHAQVEEIRWAVHQINQDNQTFLGAPNGYPSYYFWSQVSPPSSLNATYWPMLLNNDQQESVAEQIRRNPGLSLLVRKDAGSWEKLDTPLVNFLRTHFEPVADHGNQEIWKRKRQLKAKTTPGIPLSSLFYHATDQTLAW